MKKEAGKTDKLSKTMKVLQALKSGRTLTCKQMYLEFGLQRGSVAIHRIRQMGFVIDTTMVYEPNGDCYGKFKMLNLDPNQTYQSYEYTEE